MLTLAAQMMNATVELEQQLRPGLRRVGAGFLMASTCAEMRPCTVLVTADHVFRGMAKGTVTVGYRVEDDEGGWTFAPEPVRIRDSAGSSLWTRHPSRDIAVIEVVAPEPFARAAIPADYLAQGPGTANRGLQGGDELLTLGFPEGLAANGAGFPILRAGRVSSYPLSPISRVPTFLLDFSVFGGNSGGPVFAAESGGDGRRLGSIAGLLTQQVEDARGRLAIGIVTQAQFIVETLALLQTSATPTPQKVQSPTSVDASRHASGDGCLSWAVSK